MGYILSDTQKNIKEMVSEFAKREVEPKAEELDHNAKYPAELIEKVSELQLTSLVVPSEAGGPGLDTLSYCLILEELSRSCASLGLTLETHNSLVLFPILHLGSEDQKKGVLSDLIKGSKLGTMAVYEEDGGCNPDAWTTTAQVSGEGYVLNGTKVCVVGGQVAEDILVAVRMDDGPALFLVKRDQVSAIEPDYVLGMRSAGLATLKFENVQLGKDAMIGEGNVEDVIQKALTLHSLGTSAVAVGVARNGLEASVEYANTRSQFNRAIGHFPAVQWMITDMGTNVEASRLLVHKAAVLYDAGEDISQLASMAKLKSAETTMDNAIKASQIHGGLGYTTESVAEKLMRDAKTLQVLGISSEAHRDKIAKRLLGI